MNKKFFLEEIKNSWVINLRIRTPKRKIEYEMEKVVETSDDARDLLVAINQIKDTIESIYEEAKKEAR